jgi:hypothetical protein
LRGEFLGLGWWGELKYLALKWTESSKYTRPGRSVQILVELLRKIIFGQFFAAI